MAKRRNPTLHLALHPDMIARLEEVRESFGFQNRTDAARFLIARGFEATMTATAARDVVRQVFEGQSSADLLPLFAELDRQRKEPPPR